MDITVIGMVARVERKEDDSRYGDKLTLVISSCSCAWGSEYLLLRVDRSMIYTKACARALQDPSVWYSAPVRDRVPDGFPQQPNAASDGGEKQCSKAVAYNIQALQQSRDAAMPLSWI